MLNANQIDRMVDVIHKVGNVGRRMQRIDLVADHRARGLHLPLELGTLVVRHPAHATEHLTHTRHTHLALQQLADGPLALGRLFHEGTQGDRLHDATVFPQRQQLFIVHVARHIAEGTATRMRSDDRRGRQPRRLQHRRLRDVRRRRP